MDPACFYEVLGLPRGCSAEDIRQAYRRLAVLHHPDKNPGNEEAAASIFKLIGEAYEVLSDVTLRGIYDRHGREGIRAHECGAHPAPATPAARAASSSPFQDDFAFRHAHDIFTAFFGGQDPFAAMHQRMGGAFGTGGFDTGFPGFPDDDFFAEMPSSIFGGGGRIPNRPGSLFDRPGIAFAAAGGGFGAFASAASASASSSSSSSSSSHTMTSGNGSSRSVRRILRVGLDGTRHTRIETTVMRADGRQEMAVEEYEEASHQEPRLAPPPIGLGLEQQQQQAVAAQAQAQAQYQQGGQQQQQAQYHQQQQQAQYHLQNEDQGQQQYRYW